KVEPLHGGCPSLHVGMAGLLVFGGHEWRIAQDDIKARKPPPRLAGWLKPSAEPVMPDFGEFQFPMKVTVLGSSLFYAFEPRRQIRGGRITDLIDPLVEDYVDIVAEFWSKHG